jgi:putative tricarboxylic transport membrane protein
VYLDAIAAAAANVFSWPGILLPVGGTLLAMVTAFLPGIGNTSLVVLLMVWTIGWDPVSVLLLFGALTGGATFMGSITAILFNIPGSVASTASLLEGFPLGRRGFTKTAIACAAMASALGSLFGVVLLLLTLPVIEPLLVQLGPLEKLLIGLWGLTSLIAVPSRSLLKSALMALLGLLLAMPGVDPTHAEPRWTLGSLELADGLSAIPVLLGLFTLAEIIEWMRRYDFKTPQRAVVRRADGIGLGLKSVLKYPGLTVRSSLIGTLVGMVPGVGGTVASFAAYGHAAQSTPGAQRSFGRGSLRGLIAPEAAVDAKDGGSLLPAVAFGLPGSEAGVILLTVFALHGLVPGGPMLNAQLPLTLTLVLALLFSNLLTSVLGVLLTPWLARLKGFPLDKIALPGLLISLLSVLQINGYLTDLYTAVVFGLAGYVLARANWPRVPFVIAFVLGDLIETNLAMSLELAQLGRLAPLERPTTLFLLGLIALTLWWVVRKPRVRGVQAVDAFSDVVIAMAMFVLLGVMAVLAGAGGGRAYSPYAWSVLGTAALLTACVWAHAWGQHRLAAVPEHPAVLPPAAQRFALLALLLLPPAVWCFGVSVSLGLLAGGWTAQQGGRPAVRLARGLLLSVVVGFAVDYALSDLAQLLLPEPALGLWSRV